MGYEHSIWCKYPKMKGYHNEDFYQMKKEIKRLIQEGPLNKYFGGGFDQSGGDSKSQRRDPPEIRKSRKGKYLRE